MVLDWFCALRAALAAHICVRETDVGPPRVPRSVFWFDAVHQM